MVKRCLRSRGWARTPVSDTITGMSTKIYDGFIVNGDVFDFIDDILPSLLAESRRIGNVNVANKSVHAADTELVRAPEDEDSYALLRVVMSERDKSKEEGELPPSAIRLSFARDDSGRIVGIPQYHALSLLNIVRNHPMTGGWSYWNNSDRPHDVSDEEWESRRASWDYALRHDPLGTISRNMFMREFDDGGFTLCALGDNSDLWDHLPDFVRSRTSRARSLLSSALLYARASDINSSNFLSAFRSAERCISNNEDALAELARILPTPSHEYVLNRHDVDDDVVAIVDAVVAGVSEGSEDAL